MKAWRSNQQHQQAKENNGIIILASWRQRGVKGGGMA